MSYSKGLKAYKLQFPQKPVNLQAQSRWAACMEVQSGWAKYKINRLTHDVTVDTSGLFPLFTSCTS